MLQQVQKKNSWFFACKKLHRRDIMIPVANHLFFVLLAILLLCCNTSTAKQGARLPENAAGVLTGQNPPLSKTVAQADELGELTFLTLTPSVDTELLRDVMPNNWRELEQLTEAEEQGFIRENMTAILAM
jgi:hypothetical protein